MTRTVLVTGASRGVGRAAVGVFADRGWRVLAGCRSPEDTDLAGRAGVEPARMDMTDRASVRDAVAAAERLGGGRLDCLVNNAAYGVLGAVEDVDLDDVREMFETNVFGALAAMQDALPGMRERGGGVIVNVSSIGGRITNPLVGTYHASKYALTSLSEALALEGSPFGVRVALIEPGMVDTDFSSNVRPSGSLASGDGPYGAMAGQLGAGFRAWRQRFSSTAEDVAVAIADAAEDPATPFQVLVGTDAEELAAERAARDGDAFRAYTREFLQLPWD